MRIILFSRWTRKHSQFGIFSNCSSNKKIVQVSFEQNYWVFNVWPWWRPLVPWEAYHLGTVTSKFWAVCERLPFFLDARRCCVGCLSITVWMRWDDAPIGRAPRPVSNHEITARHKLLGLHQEVTSLQWISLAMTPMTFVIVHNILAYFTLSLSAAQVYVIKERCWFSQINFFVEYFPHRINIVFLSSQFYVIHIHR